jgi:hypothetical protein
MPYPKEITDHILHQNAHIPTAEIRQDIADTEREITALRAEIEGHQIIVVRSSSPHQRKMATFNVDAKKAGVEQRQAFVAFLQRLLEVRGER